MLEVAEGMLYIHSEGIVHGDLHGVSIVLDDVPRPLHFVRRLPGKCPP